MYLDYFAWEDQAEEFRFYAQIEGKGRHFPSAIHAASRFAWNFALTLLD